jgi:cytidine deaminase
MDAVNQALYEAAQKVRKKAHVPYSHFPVGAAILADDGNVYAGCNVENAAYPLGACAEGSAISAMVAGGGTRIHRIFVIGDGDKPVTPCGGCRQRIREFASADTVVICAGEDAEPVNYTMNEILPDSFGPEFLEDKA